MEIEQLQLWARWLELQRDRAIAVLELEQEEEAEGRRKIWMKQWLARRPLYGHYEQLHIYSHLYWLSAFCLFSASLVCCRNGLAEDVLTDIGLLKMLYLQRPNNL